MSVYAGPEISNDGLVLCLDASNIKSYPGSGTTWFDLSGNSNNGAINGPTFSSTNLGSFAYAGGSNQINVTNASSLNFTAAVTLSSWFKFNTLPSAELGLFRKEVQWQLGLTDSNTIRCLIATNGTSGWTAANDVDYNFLTNTWYNMTMTYNGSIIQIYVNSVLVKTGVVTGTIVTNSNNVQVGYHTSYLDGNISNCQIYSRALSDIEIQQNFNALRGRFGI